MKKALAIGKAVLYNILALRERRHFKPHIRRYCLLVPERVEACRAGWRSKQKENKKMAVVSMKQLLEAGVHFGHQTRRWNPKMATYIYT